MKTLTGYMKTRAINESDLVPWENGYKEVMSPATLKTFKEAVLKVMADEVFDDKTIMKHVEDWLRSEGCYNGPSGNCSSTDRAMHIILPYVAAFVNTMRNLTHTQAMMVDKAIRKVAPKVCKTCKGVRL